jgi:CO/xanthine dehydrogenase Mo-binding subunit
MSASGIGAAVRRKEDQRFITGIGHYTADLDRPGQTRCPGNPLGIKGCGEAGAIAAPAAVINAITDAIGTENLATPATAQAVWSALQKVNNSRKAA